MKKNLSKLFIALGLTLIMALSFIACASNSSSDKRYASASAYDSYYESADYDRYAEAAEYGLNTSAQYSNTREISKTTSGENILAN